MMGLQSSGHALVRSALHKAGSRQICVCKARSTDTLALLGCYAFQDVHLGEPSLARVVSAAGVQPTRPGSIPVGDNPRVSPGKIPLREAERVWWCVGCELLSRRILGPPR